MSENWPFGRISQGTIRNECIAYLREIFPEITVVSIEPESLRLELPTGAGHQVYLDRVYSAIGELDTNDPAARRHVYESFFKVLNDKIPDELDPQVDRQRLRPRVISQETLSAMQHQVGIELPKLPLENTGLWVVFVLDSEHSVAFVTAAMQAKLGMSLQELYDCALQNLEGTFDAAGFLEQLEAGSMVRLMTMDSYDAARVLLFPKHLPQGKRLAVAVPDRDLLMVLLAENDDAFEVISQVAKIPSERPVFDGALEITCDGIRIF